MMTDERIRYFLKKDIIPDDEYKALVKHYFQADKTDWYQQNEDGKWDKVKVQQFWRLIRKHHMPFCKKEKLYYFRKFVFPPFETTINPHNYDDIIQNGDFWEQDEKRVFTYAADFQEARFMSYAMFLEIVFQRTVNLSNTIFWKIANFSYCVFTRDILVERASFKSSTYLRQCTFKGDLDSKESEFRNTSSDESEFQGRCIVNKTLFDGKVTFKNTRFAETTFQDLVGKPELDFRNTLLPASLLFRRVNLTNTNFNQSDVTEVQFKECYWGGKARIILWNDERSNEKTIVYYAGLEEIYRQLKKNFDSNKDWELSGKAYISEMEMRKKRLYKQKDYYHWFIYWFYDKTSGYTQSLKRPIISLIALITISSLIYYFIDYSPLWAVQRGIYGALPKLITIDIPKELQFSGYWLIATNIETILGSTFLVFFILALRKRFKQ